VRAHRSWRYPRDCIAMMLSVWFECERDTLSCRSPVEDGAAGRSGAENWPSDALSSALHVSAAGRWGCSLHVSGPRVLGAAPSAIFPRTTARWLSTDLAVIRLATI
jgi:hypothetical protein